MLRSDVEMRRSEVKVSRADGFRAQTGFARRRVSRPPILHIPTATHGAARAARRARATGEARGAAPAASQGKGPEHLHAARFASRRLRLALRVGSSFEAPNGLRDGVAEALEFTGLAVLGGGSVATISLRRGDSSFAGSVSTFCQRARAKAESRGQPAPPPPTPPPPSPPPPPPPPPTDGPTAVGVLERDRRGFWSAPQGADEGW